MRRKTPSTNAVVEVTSKPADLGESGWVGILPSRKPNPALQQDIESDYCIVGAGIAGLNAARRLRQLEPKASIVLLEAQAIADGPAGRNSGYMIDLPHALKTGSYIGEDSQDRREIRMNRSAIAFATDIAQSYGFDRETFDACGKVNAAASQGGVKHLRDYALHLDRLCEDYEILDSKAMQALCGSQYYHGGLRTPHTVLVQPARYVREFADALVSREACQLFEHSPVTTLSKAGEDWHVQTESGSITSPRVILAVNGLIESFGFYRHRLMHINLYGSMTRALKADEIDRLGGAGRWGFTPADPIGSSVRKIDGTGGMRIVIRNRCTYDPALTLPAARLDDIALDHDRTFAARFPDLAGIDMAYRWSGRLCLSRNDAWALGEIKPGLFSACCQNGLGWSRGTMAGIVIAEKASSTSQDSLVPDYQDNPMPSKLFPEPFMAWAASSVIRFQEWRAGKEL